MTDPTVVVCPSCGRKNRVPAAASGVARCGNCHSPLPWIVDADASTYADVVERAALPVLVDLWAPWCGPCRMVAPELQKVAARQAGQAIVVKVNTDELSDLGQRFGIRSIPTLAVFEGGKEIARESGARPAPEIEAFIARARAATPA
jgi:thioredoxin 2